MVVERNPGDVVVAGGGRWVAVVLAMVGGGDAVVAMVVLSNYIRKWWICDQNGNKVEKLGTQRRKKSI
ncbi:hypothetical protein Hanom_Chr06g00559111 [Helianthus anomalus]